jgi:hypothetical protein
MLDGRKTWLENVDDFAGNTTICMDFFNAWQNSLPESLVFFAPEWLLHEQSRMAPCTLVSLSYLPKYLPEPHLVR